ncbi:MAG: hypothetical protein ACREPM_08445 [Gemmatimonadaceae bacterium]
MMSPRRFAGVVWFLSWFELYLEIFRHHHVTAALLLHPSNWFVTTNGAAQPGGWLRGVLVCSAVAPVLFAGLVGWRRLGRPKDARSSRALSDGPFPFGSAAAVFGAALIILATINQLIRHDPIDFNLALTSGNGGFVVLGSTLVALGLLLRRLRSAR